MKTSRSVPLLLLLAALSALAQGQGKPLSNNDVIQMAKAGLSTEVIKAKLINTEAAFDTSPDALSKLKDAGVPQDVILTIVTNPLGSKSVTRNNPPTNSAAAIEPELGTIQDIKGLSKIFVRAEDDDERTTIINLLGGYEGVQVVNSVKEAEIVIDYSVLTRDVAANYGPYARGASMAKKSQMRAYAVRVDGANLIAWTETETFDVTNGFVLGASNEVNLTHHFVRALQKARGEETYSLRKLFQKSQKHKKEQKAKKS